ncbi:YtxH domain-containing protein, partial [Staphylococcus capitis]
SKANETIQDVKSNPKGYVERIKNDPKAFFEEEKTRFTKLDENKADDLEEGKFDDEGGATANNNLRVVSEEDLKNNKN